MSSLHDSSQPKTDTKSTTLNWGNVPLQSRYLLAPLAGHTNLPYRLAVRRVGGLGLATTDLVNARALLMGSKRTRELIETCPEDRPVAVQIYGTDGEEMSKAAKWLEDYGVTSIDVNMGCPVNKVTRKGGGSAMMCDREKTIGVVAKIVEAVSIPISVKMRLGWDDNSLTAPAFAREFEKVGVAAVIVHGRTREQGFNGEVNLAGIREVVEAVERIPVIGNGDVRTIEDAARMFSVTGCDGIAIGRGCLMNPWIFTQLLHFEQTGQPGPVPTYSQRLEFMVYHFELLMKYWQERFACITFRKFGSWYGKVLQLGKQARNQFSTLESAARFFEIVDEMRQSPKYLQNEEWPTNGFSIRVPSGPISHW